MRKLAMLMTALMLLNGCTIWVCCDDKTESGKEKTSETKQK